MSPMLQGKVAVVTGASDGIGLAIARALAAERADVWLLGRRDAALAAAADAVRRAGRGSRAWTYAVDLRSDDALARFRDRLSNGSGGAVDILVHNAGVHCTGAVAEAPVADLDEQYQVNVRAPYVLTQLLLPLLQERQGQIVFMNSSQGLDARPCAAAYAATKHALKALADALRHEVNPAGVRVISVYPGRTATPLQVALHEREGKPYCPDRLLQPRDVAAAVVQALAMARTAEVTDIQVRPMRPPAARTAV